MPTDHGKAASRWTDDEEQAMRMPEGEPCAEMEGDGQAACISSSICGCPTASPSDDRGREGEPSAPREAPEMTNDRCGVPRAEVDGLAAYWAAWPGLRERLFVDDGAPYLRPRVGADEVGEEVNRHGGAWSWLHAYIDAMDDLPELLAAIALDGPEKEGDPSAKAEAHRLIGERLEGNGLVNPLDAHRALDDAWGAVEADLALIRAEGLAACRRVDPRVVLRRGGGAEARVREGWEGRVFSFDFVQRALACEPQPCGEGDGELARIASDLRNDRNTTDDLEAFLARTADGLSEVLESLSEDEKRSPAVNDTGDGFVFAELERKVEGMRSENATDLERKLLLAYDALVREREAAAALGETLLRLDDNTKAAIERLDDGTCRRMLARKWFVPVVASICRLAEDAIDGFVWRVQTLYAEHGATYAQAHG